jgi:hypothetical protein
MTQPDSLVLNQPGTADRFSIARARVGLFPAHPNRPTAIRSGCARRSVALLTRESTTSAPAITSASSREQGRTG